MNYEELLMTADAEGLIVREKQLIGSNGRCKGRRIAIRQNLPTIAEKADVLAEELGHYYTTVGRIINQSSVRDLKQEQSARLWAYNHRIGLSGIIQGYRQHCRNRYELAECLGVSEETLKEALEMYRAKYGRSVEIDGYVIFFEPSLAVMEKCL